MSQSELKKCPFCGQDVEFVDLYSGPGMQPSTSRMVIGCSHCDYYIEFNTRPMHKMRQIWNTRKEAKDGE